MSKSYLLKIYETQENIDSDIPAKEVKGRVSDTTIIGDKALSEIVKRAEDEAINKDALKAEVFAVYSDPNDVSISSEMLMYRISFNDEDEAIEEKPYIGVFKEQPLYQALEKYVEGDPTALYENILNNIGMRQGDEIRSFIENLPLEEDKEKVDVSKEDIKALQEKAIINYIEVVARKGDMKEAIKLIANNKIDTKKINADNINIGKTLSEHNKEWLEREVDSFKKEQGQKKIKKPFPKPK